MELIKGIAIIVGGLCGAFVFFAVPITLFEAFKFVLNKLFKTHFHVDFKSLLALEKQKPFGKACTVLALIIGVIALTWGVADHVVRLREDETIYYAAYVKPTHRSDNMLYGDPESYIRRAWIEVWNTKDTKEPYIISSIIFESGYVNVYNVSDEHLSEEELFDINYVEIYSDDYGHVWEIEIVSECNVEDVAADLQHEMTVDELWLKVYDGRFAIG